MALGVGEGQKGGVGVRPGQIHGTDGHLHPRLLGQLKAAGNVRVVGGQVQQPRHNGPVGAVAGAGGGKRAVELDVRLHRLAAQQMTGHPAHAGGARRMRAGRPHHNGAHNVEDVQKAFRLCKESKCVGPSSPAAGAAYKRF